MAIKNQGRVVAGVRYSLLYRGRILDVYDFAEGQGKVTDLIERVDRNPGMHIVAEVYRDPPGQEVGPHIVTMRRVIYPPSG